MTNPILANPFVSIQRFLATISLHITVSQERLITPLAAVSSAHDASCDDDCIETIRVARPAIVPCAVADNSETVHRYADRSWPHRDLLPSNAVALAYRALPETPLARTSGD